MNYLDFLDRFLEPEMLSQTPQPHTPYNRPASRSSDPEWKLLHCIMIHPHPD